MQCITHRAEDAGGWWSASGDRVPRRELEVPHTTRGVEDTTEEEVNGASEEGLEINIPLAVSCPDPPLPAPLSL